MSFSLKREIELYINDVDSTDGVCKLPVLPEFNLEIKASLLQVFRKIIGEDPEMLPRSAVDQISPVVLGFMTYLKPSYLDGLVGVTAPEKILFDSLGGTPGYRGGEFYQAQFARINRLLPIYIFIKTTTAVYKISPVYIDSVEIAFDIDYILTAKWTGQAVNLESYSASDITFTNVKDYSSIDTYLRTKFTEVYITDYDNDTEYVFPITSSAIKIQNVLMPVYDKNVTVVTGTPKDLIVTGRSISGELECYLSSRINHSVDFLKNILDDTTKVNRKYGIHYIVSDSGKRVEFVFNNAIINLPNVEFDDVLSAKLEFTSAESEYGLNDDLILRYYVDNQPVSYDDYLTYKIKPAYYYKFNEVQNTTVYNYGAAGASYNLARTNSAPTLNLAGPYLNSKSWNFYNTTCNTGTVKPAVDGLFTSFWWQPTTVNANEFLFKFQIDTQDFFVAASREGSIAGGDYRGVIISCGYQGFKFDIPSIGPWYHIVIYTKASTGNIVVYCNNVKKVDSTYTTGGVGGEFLCLGCTGGNGTHHSRFSEVIISQNITLDELPSVVNTLYTISDKNAEIENVDVKYSAYADSLLFYKGFSDYYRNIVTSYNAKAYWRFNDNDSKKIRDHITGAYPLTLSNNPELGLDGPLLNDDKSKSVWFNRLGNGTLQYTTSSSPISTSGITKNTYTFWVYIDNDNLPDANYHQCLIKTGSNTNTVFTLLKRTGGGTTFIDGKWYYNYSVGYSDGYYDCSYDFATYFKIPLQTWTFIALSCNRSNNTIKIYVNGIYIGTTTNSNVNSYWPSTIALEVGKRTYIDSYRSTFRLSEFAYFENELSETTIQGIYTASGITGFSYIISPVRSHININKKTPVVSLGILSYPSNANVNISGNIVKIGIRSNLIPSTGHVTTIRNLEILPTIGTFSFLVPITGNLIYEGSSGIVIGIAKTVSVTTGHINLSGNLPNYLYKRAVISGNIICQNYETYVVRGILPSPSTGELQVNKYNLPYIRNKIKAIKPSSGNITINIDPNNSPYFNYLITYPTMLYYKFNESSGTNLLDYSSNNRTATLYNTPTFNAGGPLDSGYTATFFNKASLEHAIYNTALSFPSKGTISFWIKPSGTATYDHVFQFNYAYNQGNNTNYFKMTKEGSVYLIMPFASGWNGNWQISLSDDVWQHVAITWDTTLNQISTYKDGSVVTNNGSHSSWPSSLQPLGICRGNTDGTSHYMSSTVSNFCLTSQRLSAAEISTLYNKVFTVTPYNNIPVIQIVSQLQSEYTIIFL